MTDDDLDLLRRKAAAFDAIASGGVGIGRNGSNYNQWCAFATSRAETDGPTFVSFNLLEAIESALSVDRQTPKGTFGEVAE